ncbi:MAG: hypothetical protein IPI67_23510 [Myxococcales bacterium]|nr:hypothetical protein [Myxococcales bacterium]
MWAKFTQPTSLQAFKARWHALDYTSDLTFWRATQRSVPRSAKAQLNYSVMVGAHNNDLAKRLELNGEAKRLAPQWPMAHVYYGDTLCRMNKPEDALPHYVTGFELGPKRSQPDCAGHAVFVGPQGDRGSPRRAARSGGETPGSWLNYFAIEIVYRGEEHKGIEKKYRPRGYDEGPKKD